MILLFFGLAFALLAQAGEIGVRLEGQEPAGTLWVSQGWARAGWSLAGRVEAELFPLRFQRARAQLTGDLGALAFTAEVAWLGTGRMDLLLGGTGKLAKTLDGWRWGVQGGGKAGWIAFNIAPTWILTTWALFYAESPAFSLVVSLDGPWPWQPLARLRIGPLAVSLGSSLGFGGGGEAPPWSAEFFAQVWPKPLQSHLVRWSRNDQVFQVSFTSEGQAWCRLSTSRGDWRLGAFAAFDSFRLTRMTLELIHDF